MFRVQCLARVTYISSALMCIMFSGIVGVCTAFSRTAGLYVYCIQQKFGWGGSQLFLQFGESLLWWSECDRRMEEERGLRLRKPCILIPHFWKTKIPILLIACFELLEYTAGNILCMLRPSRDPSALGCSVIVRSRIQQIHHQAFPVIVSMCSNSRAPWELWFYQWG